jgi:hypothetical protein
MEAKHNYHCLIDNICHVLSFVLCMYIRARSTLNALIIKKFLL